MHRLIAVLATGLSTIASALPPGAAAVASPATSLPPTRSQVVKGVMRSSVRVQVYASGELRRTATGVVVQAEADLDGRPARSVIMTNAHVADPAGLKDVTYSVLIEAHGRVIQTAPATLLALGHVPEVDLALLSVELKLPPAELGQEDRIDVGDEVVVVGAPYGKSLSVSGGLVSQLEPEDGDTLRYKGMKTDAAIGYGCSGGGVFEIPSGRLIGIVEGYRTARVSIDDERGFDVPMPGETFVAPVTKVRRFLAAHESSTSLTAMAPTPAVAAPALTGPAIER